MCGGTEYKDEIKVLDAVSQYPAGSIVVHGEAAGADSFGDKAAPVCGMFRVRVPYAGHMGRAGGPGRNRLIGKIVIALRDTWGYEPVCLAFGGDRGTDSAIKVATNLGIEVIPFDR